MRYFLNLLNGTGSKRYSFLSLILLLSITASSALGATGNLLTDPGFESNPLISPTLVLGPPFTIDTWSAEQGSISGPSDGITPADGVLMLKMTDDGGLTTQSFQLIDVSPYSGPINGGLVTVDASALFNVPADISAAVASVSVSYYDASHSPLGFSSAGSGTLPGGFVDKNPLTWQSLNIVGASVPVGTQFMLMQMAYNNASMYNPNNVNRPGFNDHTSLTLNVPEPSTLVLAAFGLIGLFVVRRRNRAAA
jgi:hypothetical protein